MLRRGSSRMKNSGTSANSIRAASAQSARTARKSRRASSTTCRNEAAEFETALLKNSRIRALLEIRSSSTRAGSVVFIHSQALVPRQTDE